MTNCTPSGSLSVVQCKGALIAGVARRIGELREWHILQAVARDLVDRAIEQAKTRQQPKQADPIEQVQHRLRRRRIALAMADWRMGESRRQQQS